MLTQNSYYQRLFEALYPEWATKNADHRYLFFDDTLVSVLQFALNVYSGDPLNIDYEATTLSQDEDPWGEDLEIEENTKSTEAVTLYNSLKNLIALSELKNWLKFSTEYPIEYPEEVNLEVTILLSSLEKAKDVEALNEIARHFLSKKLRVGSELKLRIVINTSIPEIPNLIKIFKLENIDVKPSNGNWLVEDYILKLAASFYPDSQHSLRVNCQSCFELSLIPIGPNSLNCWFLQPGSDIDFDQNQDLNSDKIISGVLGIMGSDLKPGSIYGLGHQGKIIGKRLVSTYHPSLKGSSPENSEAVVVFIDRMCDLATPCLTPRHPLDLLINGMDGMSLGWLKVLQDHATWWNDLLLCRSVEEGARIVASAIKPPSMDSQEPKEILKVVIDNNDTKNALEMATLSLARAIFEFMDSDAIPMVQTAEKVSIELAKSSINRIHANQSLPRGVGQEQASLLAQEALNLGKKLVNISRPITLQDYWGGSFLCLLYSLMGQLNISEDLELLIKSDLIAAKTTNSEAYNSQEKEVWAEEVLVKLRKISLARAQLNSKIQNYCPAHFQDIPGFPKMYQPLILGLLDEFDISNSSLPWPHTHPDLSYLGHPSKKRHGGGVSRFLANLLPISPTSINEPVPGGFPGTSEDSSLVDLASQHKNPLVLVFVGGVSFSEMVGINSWANEKSLSVSVLSTSLKLNCYSISKNILGFDSCR